jgi:hypothetical protein
MRKRCRFLRSANGDDFTSWVIILDKVRYRKNAKRNRKGEKADPDNYRGINLLDTTLKLATRIIIEKIGENNKDIEVGGSCTDAVFIIRQSKEKSGISRVQMNPGLSRRWKN